MLVTLVSGRYDTVVTALQGMLYLLHLTRYLGILVFTLFPTCSVNLVMMAVVIPKAVSPLQANSVCSFSCSIFDHVFTAKTNKIRFSSATGIPRSVYTLFLFAVKRKHEIIWHKSCYFMNMLVSYVDICTGEPPGSLNCS